VNVFNGNPTATGITLSPAVTNICGTTTYTATITGLGNYDVINWTAPVALCSAGNVVAANFGNGSTTLVVSGGTGGSGVISVTVSNPCNTISATTATINCSAAAPAGTLTAASTVFCSATATDVITYSAADYTTIVWAAPAAICSPAVVTAANTANAATLTLSGGTGGAGRVTATLNNYCTPPALVLNTPIITDYAAATTTPCNPDLLTLNGLANYATITWAAPASLCSPAVITAANLANATTLTISGGTGGTGTVTATIANNCGSIVETSPSITYTPSIISIDGTNEVTSSANVNATTVSTATPNELVLITLTGFLDNGGSNVTVDGNATTLITSVTNLNVATYLYGYIAPLANAAHAVSITWGGMRFAGSNTSLAQVSSFKGFCGTPSLAANVNIQTASGIARTNTTETITPGAANSYLFGSYINRTNANIGVITWTGANQFAGSPYHINAAGDQWDISFAGIQDANVAAATVSCTDTKPATGNNNTTELLCDIHP
jgi:hypothetical protein